MILANNFLGISKGNGWINRSSKKDSANNNKDFRMKCMLNRPFSSIV